MLCSCSRTLLSVMFSLRSPFNFCNFVFFLSPFILILHPLSLFFQLPLIFFSFFACHCVTVSFIYFHVFFPHCLLLFCPLVLLFSIFSSTFPLLFCSVEPPMFFFLAFSGWGSMSKVCCLRTLLSDQILRSVLVISSISLALICFHTYIWSLFSYVSKRDTGLHKTELNNEACLKETYLLLHWLSLYSSLNSHQTVIYHLLLIFHKHMQLP